MVSVAGLCCSQTANIEIVRRVARLGGHCERDR
jgi:hypothetical protein